ncbi:hypothetical protein [Polycladidibacter stylochi]|uniref:hypothetical protein n=1 Tax=Polycladidibacter stylochi TaxID=1807766 RepID=UPI00082C27A4|nr:hypothetical protein [Pseudovibrio stylochi]
MLDQAQVSQSVWPHLPHQATTAIKEVVAHLAEDVNSNYLLDCLILERGIQSRLSSKAHKPRAAILNQQQRQELVSELLALWSSGAKMAINEQLFWDTVMRRPNEYSALKQRYCKQSVRKGELTI